MCLMLVDALCMPAGVGAPPLNTATVTISLHHSPDSVSFVVILLFIMTQPTITMAMVMIIINPAPPVTPA